MLKIFHGPEGLNKEKFIFDHINPDRKTILIVPDQFSLQIERAALEYFREKSGRTALLNLMVTDFTVLGHKVVKEAGGREPELIDKYGRHMLLSVLISRLAKAGRLSVYQNMGNKTSFAAETNQLISEMKRYGVKPSDLETALDNTESYLRLKLTDIEKIYAAYEDSIEGRFTDSEDYVTFYGELMEESSLIEGAEIWVYGFDTFSPLNLNVIGNLLARADSMNVVMTWTDNCEKDARVLTTGGGEGLFDLTAYVMDNLEELAKAGESGFAREEICCEERETVWKDGIPECTLAQASNMYAEADRVAAHIVKLTRDKGYRYGDITVICNDMDIRGGILKRTLDRWGIPAFADRKRRVLHQPVVRFILSFLDVIAGGYDGNAIMEMISAGLMGWSREDEELINNYVNEAGIRSSKWKKEFIWAGKDGRRVRYSPEDLERLNQMRAQIVAITEKARDEMGRRNSAGEKIRGLYEFLENDFQITTRIKELIDKQNELGLAEGAAETAQSWNMICGLFTQIIRVIGEDQLSNAQLQQILTCGFEEMEIGLVPTSTDCVIIGTLQRTRVSRTRSLIVAGANEGILPLQPGDTGLLTERELDTLEELKLSISKREEVRQQEEQLAIYRMFSLPSEDLFVSCSLADQEGKTATASGIFTVLSEMGIEVLGDLGRNDITEMISSRKGTMTYMAEAMHGFLETGNIDKEWLAVMNWFAENDEEALAAIRQGLEYDNKLEALGRALAEDLYFGDKDAILVSASRLESYSGCPFKHFVEKGLKAEEPRGFEIDGRSRGDVFHKALQVLSMKLTPDDGTPVTDPSSPWMTITETECKEAVSEIVMEDTADYREGVYQSDPESKLQLEILIDNCSEMAWSMIRQIRKGKVSQMHFEEPFGFSGSRLEPIEIRLEGGKKAILQGKIDRIDVIDVGNDKAIRVIDYKTGNETIRKEYIEKGYKLQLMIYMNAAGGDAQPAGVFYFKIKDLDTNADNDGTPEQKGTTVADRIDKDCRLEGVFVEDESMIKAMDETIVPKSSSVVIPVQQLKDESFKAYSDSEMLSRDEFNELMIKTQEQVDRICHEIQNGVIEIKPKREKDKDSTGSYKNACTFCDYKSICLFDTSFRSCRYELV
ncbi:MAG: PD-(D/E)XK nuclease family protein [Clostridia bacterium]|nr:PD-(D/E)XK nuclease family protein [Clostridia bacterium]